MSHSALVRAWRADVRWELDSSYLVQNVLLLAHGRTLEAWDRRTGNRLWKWPKKFLDDHESFFTWSADGPIVTAAASEPYDIDDDDTDERTTVYSFDARSGIRLWSLTSGYTLDAKYFELMGSGGGQVLLLYPRSGYILSLDGSSGVRRWRARLWPGCEFSGTGAVNDRLATVLVDCGKRLTLWALDVTSGRVLWTRPVPSESEDVMLNDALVQVTGDTSILLLDMVGKVLYRNESSMEGGAMTGGSVLGLVTSTNNIVTITTIRLTDLATGQWLGSYPLDELLGGGRNLYFTVPMTGGPYGWMLVTVGADNRRPRPLGAWRAGSDLANAWDGAFLVDTSDGDLESLSLYDVVEMPDLSDGQAARGLVPAEAWPDACALLPLTMDGRSYQRRPSAAPAFLGLSRPARCHISPTKGDAPAVALDVLWVFPDAAQAHDLISEITDVSVVSPISGADEAYQFDLQADTLIFRIGRMVLYAYTDGKPEITKRVMRHAARELRRNAA